MQSQTTILQAPLSARKIDSATCSNNNLRRVRRCNSLVDTLNAGVFDSRGGRSKMEDVHRLILWNYSNEDATVRDADEEGEQPAKRRRTGHSCLSSPHASPSVSFFVVCDGHGGVQAANYVNTHLFQNIVNQPHFEEDTENAITKGFKETEEGLAKLAHEEAIDGGVGTTVTAALIVGNVLWIANVGDSEAVICRNGKEQLLTVKHTALNEEEKSRVQQEGGVIVSNRSESRLGHPVWNPSIVNIGVTRALGDFYFKDEEWVGQKKSGLIADPKINHLELTTADEFLLIGSDGFWNVVSPQEAVDFIRRKIHFDSNTLCRHLVAMGEQRNSHDNITVLLVKFIIPTVESD